MPVSREKMEEMMNESDVKSRATKMRSSLCTEERGALIKISEYAKFAEHVLSDLHEVLGRNDAMLAGNPTLFEQLAKCFNLHRKTLRDGLLQQHVLDMCEELSNLARKALEAAEDETCGTK